MKKEVTRIITAQITCIENLKNGSILTQNQAVAERIKERLGVDDVQIMQVQDFIMDKE